MSEALTPAEEASRRDRNWDPEERWQVILRTLEWAEAQLPVKRNSREACLEHQRRHVAATSAVTPAEPSRRS